MGYHTFDADRADKLEDAQRRNQSFSAEELLWALSPDDDEAVADLGSGTGFDTDDVAPAVDPVMSDVDELPFETDNFDTAFSTITPASS